ncbi:HIT domain-containing protein [Patescibacteria group bacterium]|nr:HIT domain-containing protein [Patescibacteria group bacterium]
MTNQQSSCIFCKICSKEIPSYIIYEDDLTVAFLDIAPVGKGHALIVPKNHSENLAAATEEDAVALMKTVYKIAPIIVKTLGGTGYNLGMNHGVDAGQIVAHTHLHLMPRFAGQERTFSKLNPADHEMKEVQEILVKALQNI